MRKLLVAAALVGLVAVVAGPATAGGKGGSSIALVRLSDTARLASSDPTLGEQVTFDVSTTRTEWPWVQNRCWRNGSLVYEEWHGFWAGYYRDPIFTLGPTPNWSGGDADCQGSLVRQSSGGNIQTLATTTYHVSA